MQSSRSCKYTATATLNIGHNTPTPKKKSKVKPELESSSSTMNIATEEYVAQDMLPILALCMLEHQIDSLEEENKTLKEEVSASPKTP